MKYSPVSPGNSFEMVQYYIWIEEPLDFFSFLIMTFKVWLFYVYRSCRTGVIFTKKVNNIVIFICCQKIVCCAANFLASYFMCSSCHRFLITKMIVWMAHVNNCLSNLFTGVRVKLYIPDFLRSIFSSLKYK